MQSIYSKYKIVFLAIFALLFTMPVVAQETTATSPANITGNDPLPIILITISGVLAFVIWGLARVLLALARETVIKSKAPKALPLMLLGILLFAAKVGSAQDISTNPTAQEAAKATVGMPIVYYVLFSVLAVEVIIIIFLSLMIKRFSADLLPSRKGKLARESRLKTWWLNLEKKLTRAVPLENEKDVELDHEYDGIRELDNALPPWWKYGFYITIGFSIVYFLNYAVLGYGKNPLEEYNAQMARAKIEKENYEANNKDKIDENNVPMADASGLAVAKEIFITKCYACHGKLGEGGAGPNLTDNYWLHGGSLNAIYQSIKHGYPDKGMQAWSTVYTPKEISDLASYIKTLQGTNPPNAKAPQGDLYKDSSDSGSGNNKLGGSDSSSVSKSAN